MVKNPPANTVSNFNPGLDPLVRKIPWKREWRLTPVFLPREFQGDRAWQAIVHGVTKTWIQLTDYHFHSLFSKQPFFFIKMTSTFNYFSYAFAYLPPLWRKLHEVSNHCLPLYPQYQRTIQWTLNIQSKCSGGGNVTRQVGRWVPQVTAVQV